MRECSLFAISFIISVRLPTVDAFPSAHRRRGHGRERRFVVGCPPGWRVAARLAFSNCLKNFKTKIGVARERKPKRFPTGRNLLPDYKLLAMDKRSRSELRRIFSVRLVNNAQEISPWFNFSVYGICVSHIGAEYWYIKRQNYGRRRQPRAFGIHHGQGFFGPGA